MSTSREKKSYRALESTIRSRITKEVQNKDERRCTRTERKGQLPREKRATPIEQSNDGWQKKESKGERMCSRKQVPSGKRHQMPAVQRGKTEAFMCLIGESRKS